VNVVTRQSDNLVLRFGAFEADLHTSELRKGGRLVAVPPQPFKVLALLASRSGELVTREEIQEELWGGDTFVDFEQGLNFCIKRLRAALGDDADNPRFIETLPRRGYRFLATVEKLRNHGATPDVPHLVVRPFSPLADVSAREDAASPSQTVPPKPPSGVWTNGSAALWPRPQAAAAHSIDVVPDSPADSIEGPSPASHRPQVQLFAPRVMLIGALALVVLLSISMWIGRHWPSHPLTEKDTIVLADFANNTGEPIFEGTLKEGLRKDLEQSTFLNILSDDAVTAQLRYMGRPPGEPLTLAVAREVCRRQGSKAVLSGSISRIGSHYPITLKAVGCDDGRSLGVEQLEATRREDVLGKLHEAGSELRSRLGESLASVQKYDTPLEQATTPSLEALQAFSVASATWRSQGDAAALPLFKRALQLDPSFALAYSDLGTVYCNLGETALCAQSVSKAHELDAKVSEREKMFIDSSYYLYVTGELEKAAQVFQAWKQIYPRVPGPYIQSGLIASELGQLESGLDNDLQALRLRSDSSLVYRNLSYDYLYLNRLQEAGSILSEAHSRKLDVSLLGNSYQLAFLLNDTKEMERCLTAANGKPEFESSILASQADTEAFYGHLSKARELSRQAIASALAVDSKETAAEWQVTAALREAEFGNKNRAQQEADSALTLSPTRDVQVAAALVFARTGKLEQARAIANDLQKHFPADTLIASYWLPSIRAAMEISQKHAALAIEALQVTEPYELGGNEPPFSSGGTMYPAYLRGQAYLQMKEWQKAAAEFQKILDHRGLVWNFPLGALAPLQLGRAYAGSGDSIKARNAYKSFLARWQDADTNIPVLTQAKVESAKLH
jgi:eukaryotic-like serine/threonine-protein kinase